MKRNSFQDNKNVGCNIIFNNTSVGLKTYIISLAYLLLFFVTCDWLKKIIRDLIEKFSVMCDWNPPPPPPNFATVFLESYLRVASICQQYPPPAPKVKRKVVSPPFHHRGGGRGYDDTKATREQPVNQRFGLMEVRRFSLAL